MATLTTVSVELDEVASGSRHRIAEAALKAAPYEDHRRSGLYRRQSGTGHILREADGFLACTGNFQQRAFIIYGLAAQLWPIVILHTIMLPLNVIRLRDALAVLQHRNGTPSKFELTV